MIESRCGLLCSKCEYRESMSCKGCANIEKPFWGDSCPVKSCCEGRGHAHCGECTDFPCDLLHSFSYAEEQGDDGRRIEQCRVWHNANNHDNSNSESCFESCAVQFQLALIAVKDVEESKKFYGQLFNQKVVLDLGRNVTFSGGFAIQQDFSMLTGVPEDSVIAPAHNLELYFEVQDFEGFLKKLEQYGGIQYVHAPKMHEWKQRVVRIYDPNGHIIEIGESMAFLARKYLSKGYSAEETAEIIQHPVDFVRAAEQHEI